MYALRAYGKMIADARTNDAYARALAAVVRPGDVVLDLGCGTGAFGLMALRAGAARVYAVDGDPVLELARAIARANGVADRVTFVHGMSRAIDLPERVDVLVSDLSGVLPLAGASLPSIIDARERFLRPGGALVPQQTVIHAAVVDAPATYAAAIGVWARGPEGIDVTPARAAAVNTIERMRPGDGVARSNASVWTTIDYRTCGAPSAAGAMTFTIADGGIAHGLMLWFATTLAPGVELSSSPELPDLVHGRAFLPWPEPIALSPGDPVHVHLRADQVDDEYVWTWETRFEREPDSPRSFRQSTFVGAMLDRQALGFGL